MSLKIIVLIRKDPTTTHQPVEGLRIALGLSTGPNPLTIILLDQARLLLDEEPSQPIMDSDTLEKYIPSIQELKIPIVVPENTNKTFDLDPDFSVEEKSAYNIQSLVQEADRVLIF